MAMGRGSAGRGAAHHLTMTTTSSSSSSSSSSVVLLLSLLLLLQTTEMVQAVTIYTVGGTGGWTYNTVGWPNGKRFSAGDVLVFKYNPSFHNVVVVNGVGYNSCKTTPRGAQVFKTGNDRIKLVKGQNFFICNFVGHCESGMKIAINAM